MHCFLSSSIVWHAKQRCEKLQSPRHVGKGNDNPSMKAAYFCTSESLGRCKSDGTTTLSSAALTSCGSTIAKQKHKTNHSNARIESSTATDVKPTPGKKKNKSKQFKTQYTTDAKTLCEHYRMLPSRAFPKDPGPTTQSAHSVARTRRI